MTNLYTVREIIVAVKDAEESANDYKALGFREVNRGESHEPPLQSKFIYLALDEGTVPVLCLVQSLAPGSPVDNFIQKRGEGLFSIALGCTDMDGVMAKAKAKGASFVLDKPQEMVDGVTPFHEAYKKFRINWIKPRGPTHGVTLELQELEW
ncbi:MAG: VOC family protein [Chloroflexi bacterium]|nr:VOC family protein [Chloroflexota bacterium]